MPAYLEKLLSLLPFPPLLGCATDAAKRLDVADTRGTARSTRLPSIVNERLQHEL
jgi:hypothetical protein